MRTKTTSNERVNGTLAASCNPGVRSRHDTSQRRARDQTSHRCIGTSPASACIVSASPSLRSRYQYALDLFLLNLRFPTRARRRASILRVSTPVAVAHPDRRSSSSAAATSTRRRWTRSRIRYASDRTTNEETRAARSATNRRATQPRRALGAHSAHAPTLPLSTHAYCTCSSSR
jgi:hypothetical protein